MTDLTQRSPISDSPTSDGCHIENSMTTFKLFKIHLPSTVYDDIYHTMYDTYV